jgi:hypothetical protein
MKGKAKKKGSLKLGVFIVESNKPSDERNRWREGRALRDILRLLGCPVEYAYFRTQERFEKLLESFDQSKFRYLHFACHGTKNGFSIYSGFIKIPTFVKLAGPYLKKKRLFISSCYVTNDELARKIFTPRGIYSVIGPSASIYFSDTAVAWAAFYNLAFRKGNSYLKNTDIEIALNRILPPLGIRFKAFFRKEKRPYYRKALIK